MQGCKAAWPAAAGMRDASGRGARIQLLAVGQAIWKRGLVEGWTKWTLPKPYPHQQCCGLRTPGAATSIQI